MKDITGKLIELLRTGYCTPLISQIAKKLKEPSTTIHYNIKKLEKEGVIKAYGAVFDYKKIGKGHCVYILANLKEEKYGDPEGAVRVIAEDARIESVDIVTGEYEVIMKLRVKDIDDYYAFVKEAVKKYGFSKMVSLTSLKQMKSEFVKLE
jgi:DNA-binding Lrp family transcriptional regulator